MLSHRYDGKPAWYILGSVPWGNKRKHGVSKHISIRKNPYITTNPEKVSYDYVFLLNQDELDRKGISLYRLDSHFFPRWLEGRELGHIHCHGGGTEFYEYDDHYELAVDFFESMGIRVMDETSNDDEFPLFTGRDRKSVSECRRRLLDEDSQRDESLDEMDALLSSHNALLKKFIDVFLPGKSLRPYQRELWDIWCNQLQVKGGYRGILQWPTGSGKTFAELMLLVLTHYSYASRGEIYRAVIIAPTNDILYTQMKHLRKLKLFGINVYEGHSGRLSSLVLPNDKSFILITTHASLTKTETLETFPDIHHIHYDEVHRITGEELFANLTEWVPKWNTQYLTGTSATPLTSNPIQRDKISEIFGKEIPIIHRTDIDSLVRLGYLAKPKFLVRVIANGSDDIISRQMTEYVVEIVNKRQKMGKWKGGKMIVYLKTLEQVRLAYTDAETIFPKGWCRYMTEGDTSETYHDSSFVTDPADGIPRILFACKKYREGSDVYGLEATVPLMGKTMSVHVVLQILGRPLRSDYEEKEGWCCIVRPQFDDETEDDVLGQILFNITAFLTLRPNKVLRRKDIRRIVDTFMGDVEVRDKALDVEETIRRIQRMYVRKSEITFDKMRDLNREYEIYCRADYQAISDEHPHYIPNPQEHYRDVWTNWYDFLGVDTSNWPSTKDEWKSVCIKRGITTWDLYQKNRGDDLPPNPTEMYSDFTSWRNEFPESYVDDEWL